MCSEIKCLVSYVQIQSTTNDKYFCYHYKHMPRFLAKHSIYYTEN